MPGEFFSLDCYIIDLCLEEKGLFSGVSPRRKAAEAVLQHTGNAWGVF